MLRNIVAAFMLAIAAQACGKAPAAPETPTTTVDATVPAEGVPTRAALVGRWGDNGDCANLVVFNEDGTFEMAGMMGDWSLAGDVVTMTGTAGTFQVRVAVANANTLMIGNADGSYGMSQRC